MRLCLQLREELGPKKMAGKDAPAKRTLFNVNRKPDLIERRRRELQQWLWRLIGDPDVARSKMLNDFLELSDAARLVQRCAVLVAPGFLSHTHSMPHQHIFAADQIAG